jgi:hypothetical protein
VASLHRGRRYIYREREKEREREGEGEGEGEGERERERERYHISGLVNARGRLNTRSTAASCNAVDHREVVLVFRRDVLQA